MPSLLFHEQTELIKNLAPLSFYWTWIGFHFRFWFHRWRGHRSHQLAQRATQLGCVSLRRVQHSHITLRFIFAARWIWMRALSKLIQMNMCDQDARNKTFKSNFSRWSEISVIDMAIDHVGCRGGLVSANPKVLSNLNLLGILPSSVAAESLTSTPFTKNNVKIALISLSHCWLCVSVDRGYVCWIKFVFLFTASKNNGLRLRNRKSNKNRINYLLSAVLWAWLCNFIFVSVPASGAATDVVRILHMNPMCVLLLLST